MTLIKWNNPSKGLERRNNLMPSVESLFSDFFNSDFYPLKRLGQMPSVNISETAQAYSIEVSAPGFGKKDFNVKVEDGMLVISGEHKTETNEPEKSYVRREFNYGSFSRSFSLADSIDEENISARYENGILKLELPKNEKAKNIKEIRIS